MLINEKNGDQGFISANNQVFVSCNSDVRKFDDHGLVRGKNEDQGLVNVKNVDQ